VSASTLQKMGIGEHLFPFLLAGLEACVVDIVCVGLANIGFLGSTDLLFPLWLPFLLIATACWVTRYPTQRMLHTFPALHQQENERRYPQPLLALLCTLLLIELLFIVCAGIYAPFDLSWLTSATALTLQDLVRIVVFLGVAVFLCWCGVQIARSHVDTDSIGRNLRIVVVCLALIIVQRVVQELLYHDEMAHEDTALFFLVMLFACLSLLHILSRNASTCSDFISWACVRPSKGTSMSFCGVQHVSIYLHSRAFGMSSSCIITGLSLERE